MKTSNKRVAMSLAGLCAVGLVGFALAQSPGARADRPQLPMSIAEMQSRMHERAQNLDANRDGYVEASEFTAFREARRAERMQRRMARVDTNKDGRVSTVELEAAQLARLERADTNRDGQITREEMRALRMTRRAERMERRAERLRDPRA